MNARIKMVDAVTMTIMRFLIFIYFLISRGCMKLILLTMGVVSMFSASVFSADARAYLSCNQISSKFQKFDGTTLEIDGEFLAKDVRDTWNLNPGSKISFYSKDDLTAVYLEVGSGGEITERISRYKRPMFEVFPSDVKENTLSQDSSVCSLRSED